MSSNQGNKDNETKRWIWVPCKAELYKPAYIVEETPTSVKTQSNILETFKQSEVFKMNPTKFDMVEDLALLSNLNEPSVLHNLKRRYEVSSIYTYSGLFLISLNPYKQLGIYSDEIKKEVSLEKYREAQPHIFAVANEAYRLILSSNMNQSILITGESGAGKTENTKRVIEFLSAMAGGGDKSIYSLLLSANPILEAFGNAKTIKNDNSSRFGKFIQLKFRGGDLCGARIEKYLLEKSRVTHQSQQERSYHIFYYLLKGGSPCLLNSLGLTGLPSDYKCLAGQDSISTGYNSYEIKGIDDLNKCQTGQDSISAGYNSYEIKGIDDSKEFDKLNKCFKLLGIDNPEKYYKIIAAILHLSNIDFIENEDKIYLKEDKKLIGDNHSSSVEMACKLLNIPVTDFLKEIIHPSIKAGKETVAHSRTRNECIKVIEGLMKVLYESLFNDLVYEINTILDTNSSNSFIGVLDIAGFEIFEKNSFEQLCINYTNEKLQQFFNHHMFVLEQEIYKNECIEWNFIDFGLDLEPTIRLIESNNPIGILSYLDEECVMPQANDNTLLGKIKGISGVERCPFPNSFKIRHYAGVVEYEVVDWLNKNKDVHSENLHKLLNINTINSINVKKGIFRTVGQSHRENLKRLMEILRSTNPHFVRCILPNLNKSSVEFDKKLILDQLRCNGVLEGIRISRLGYPSRMLFNDFNERYLILLDNINNVCDDFNNNLSNSNISNSNEIIERIPKNLSAKIIESIGINKNDYKIGNTMVFLRQGILADIEILREKKLCLISKIVKNIILHKIELRKNNIKQEREKAILLLQKNMKSSHSLLKWKWWSLFIKIKPLLEVQKNEQSIREKDEQLRAYSDLIEKEREEKKRIELLNSTINSKLIESKKQNELLALALEEKDGLLEGIRKENVDLKGNVEIQYKCIESYKEKIKQDELKEENHGKLQEKLTNSIEKLKIQLKDKEECILNLIQKDGDLKIKEEKLNREILEKKELEGILELHKEECIKLVGVITGLEERLKIIPILEEKLLNQEESITNLEEKVSSRNVLIQKIKNELDDVQFQNENLQGDIRRKEHLLQDEKRQFLSLKQELDYYKTKTINLENSLLKSQEQIDIFESKIEEFNSNKNVTQENVASLNKQIKSLCIKLENAESINAELIKEKEELCDENQRLGKEKLEALCIADCRENQERKSLQLTIQKLKIENEKLRNDISNGSSSHDENMESLFDKINQQLENEKNIRKQYEKKVGELEIDNAVFENKIRELSQELKESEENAIKATTDIMHNYIPKEEMVKIKEKVEKIRTNVNSISELFQKQFFEILGNKNLQIDGLITDISNITNELNNSRQDNEKLKGIEQANLILKKELEEILKKNSLLKSEMDALTINNEILLVQIEELKEHIKKVVAGFEEREEVVEKIKKELNKKKEELQEEERILKKNLRTVQDLIKSNSFKSELEQAVKPYLDRIDCLSKEKEELNLRMVEKDYEILRLNDCINNIAGDNNNGNNSNGCDINNSNCCDIKNSNDIAPELVRERIISSFIVDKEGLKTMERKNLLSCNCGLLNKVKIIEIQKENKEELVKLINENNLLNLKLKQSERIIEEQNLIVENMKGCVSIIKKRSK